MKVCEEDQKSHKVILNHNGPFDGKGTVFQWLLFGRGWNQAPENHKFGIIEEFWPDDHQARIFFPHFDLRQILFTDEFHLENNEGKKFRLGN